MTYKILTLILGLLCLLFLSLLRFTQGDVKVFVKKTNWYLLGSLLTFAIVGLLGLLLRPVAIYSATAVAWIYYVICLGLGILHTYLLYKLLPWVSPIPGLREFLFTVAVMAIGSLSFFQVFILLEKAGRRLNASYADNLLPGIFLTIVPLLFLLCWELWLRIPQTSKQGWELPIDTRPPQPEMGARSIKLSIVVPLRYGFEENIQIDLLAPIERTLGDTFYYVIYRHNVEKNSIRKIELAEGNSRRHIYQWLFYTRSKRWFWMKRQYLDPTLRLKNTDLNNGEIIFVERLKNW
ncbi:MAG: hypothetical protein J0L99_09655 [Chitinophagales bacterium]|nr:hypothetical protein [Chitinophagales bacterium]